tara:strand:+ start:577 stop:762 length:186 start_codon:yes stop_codon:yes gene_type:complete
MKEHFCPVEQSVITYEGKCNWCAEKEWVGLTFQEQQEALLNTHSFHEALIKAEKKLKEKNT